MSTYTPFEQEILGLMKTMQSDVSVLKSDVSVLKSDVSVLKSDMIEVKGKIDTLSETVLDLKDELHAESSATRALLSQAFEHISDQMAEPDHQPIPSMVFRSRSRTPVSA